MRCSLRDAVIILMQGLTVIALGAPPEAAIKTAADPGGLIARYRELGLPFPPDDAPLVQIESGTRLTPGKEEPIIHLAFLLKRASDKEPAVLLVGTERTVTELKYQVVDPKKIKAEQIEAAWGYPFDVNTGLATAIQCRARGWDVLAQSLQDWCIKQNVGHPYTPFRQPPNLPPRSAVEHVAWMHWMNQISSPGADRAPIAKGMKDLIKANPQFDTRAHQMVLRSLEAALVPSTAKSGSIEAMIDALVDVHDAKGMFGQNEPDPRYQALALKGFEAVPALIEHLGDDRLTRSIQQGFNNFPSWPLSVKHLVSDLLQELVGDELGVDWLSRQKAGVVDVQLAQRWWEAAQKQGEEEYFVSHVLPQDIKRGYPYLVQLQIIGARYPNRLPQLFLTVLEKRRDIQLWYLAKAVTASDLSREKKLELFLKAADDADLEHRRAAYYELKSLEPRLFVEHLTKTVESLPAIPAEPYWKCREGSFANLVAQTDDPRPWAALTAAAKRADVWLRMQYLQPMCYTPAEGQQKQLRLKFLAEFMDDAEVRELPKREGMPDTQSKYLGPVAGMGFDRLEVRDMAAMTTAAILGLPERPERKPAWTPDQWAAYREQVRKAMDKEMAK